MKIVVNPRYSHLQSLFEQLGNAQLPAGATLIYDKRNKLYACTVGGTRLNIKAFHRPSFPNNYIYTRLRASKARRSYEHALALDALGIGTPEPVGFVETRHRGALRQSYYVSLQIDPDGDMRHWERHPDAEALLRAFAAETVRLHRAGVFHHDYTPGNILHTRNADGTYRFDLVDLNRMTLGAKIDRKKIVRNLRAMNIESEAETRRLARYYAEAADLDADRLADDTAQGLRDYLKHKRRLHKLKNIFKFKSKTKSKS